MKFLGFFFYERSSHMLQCVFCTWAPAIFEEIWYEYSIHVNYKVKGVLIEGWENSFLAFEFTNSFLG